MDVVLAVVISFLVGCAAIGAGIGIAAWQLTRRNRLAPHVETGAPLRWLWSVGTPARLHRRLRTATIGVHQGAAQRADGSIAATALATAVDLANTVAAESIAVDRELVAAARLPRAQRRAQVRRLRGDVVRLEQLCFRLNSQVDAGSAIDALATESRHERLDAVEQRIVALEHAHEHLRSIEHAITAADPEALLRSIAPPPPPAPVARRSVLPVGVPASPGHPPASDAASRVRHRSVARRA